MSQDEQGAPSEQVDTQPEHAATPETTPQKKPDASSLPDVSQELNRLFELCTKYPELGGPLANLTLKLGLQSFSDRLLKMQLDQEVNERGVEFHRVAATLARKEGRSQDALTHVLDGVQSVASRMEDTLADERQRLLHLVRLGFSILLFDLEDLKAAPHMVEALSTQLPTLASLYEQDPFYNTLCAQALWFTDREASERYWEQAIQLSDAEASWNSRGTWNKEADKDYARAEWAYRSGLRALPTSVLLKHNLAQALMERARHEGAELTQIRGWLEEAEALLRQGLRHTRKYSMRKHINSSMERLKSLQAELPKEEEVVEPPPEVGEVVRGRVRSFKDYGAFLTLSKQHSGLLHISEIAHERISEPGQVLKLGDVIEVKVMSVEERADQNGYRIALSRKAILPAPEVEPAQSSTSSSQGEASQKPRRERSRKKKQGRGQQRGSSSKSTSRAQDNMGSLGELLLAKLEENKKN